MGRIDRGILGSISGTVGTVVGSNWKGKQVVRAKAVRRNKTLSQAQIEQHAKFAVAGRFIKKLRKFLEISYKPKADGMTGQNVAMKELLRSAMTGVYPNFTIDYSK